MIHNIRPTFIICCLLTITILCWGNALKIYFKAIAAQILINITWEQTLEGNPQPPWPWADTTPVAMIRNEKNGDSFIVLSGGKGNSLAFGPAHIDGTKHPGDKGTSVIAGHRDTHFAFLENSEMGDRISIQSLSGIWSSYEINKLSIHDIRDHKFWHIDSDLDQLLLVTCYPFDTIDPNGPLRLIVTLRQTIDFDSVSASILSPEDRFVSSLK